MAEGGRGTAAGATKLPLLLRFPLRQVILWTLSLAIIAGVSIGTIKTLTMDPGLSGDFWRDLVVLGVAQGSIYALIALGYSLVYGILRMINFAHGEVFMAGAFGSFFVASSLAENGFLDANPVVSLFILLAVSAGVSVFVAVLLERIAYRPLRNAPRLVPLITAIGASLFLQNSFRGFFGSATRGYAVPEALKGTWMIFGIPIERAQGITMLAAILGLLALSLYVARTRTGKAMRAVAQDKEIAALMGIDVDRVIVRTFAIGGLMAGIAGVLFAITFGKVDFFMGFFPGIKAFTAAVLGGIGSIAGAALGGLIIGVLESVGPFLFLEGFDVPSPNQLKDVIPFVILVLVLIYRPTGILGKSDREKV